MTTRLSATVVMGALLCMSGLAHADVPVCSAYKHREMLAPATASSTMPVNRHPALNTRGVVTKRLIVGESAAWGTVIDCRGTILEWTLARGQTAEPLRASKADFKKPVLYSFSLMAVGFGGFVVIGILEDDPSVDNFIKSYTSPPRFEDDPLLFNFVLHPLWGSETYLRAREAHFGISGSIAFSLAASIAWEYLYESWTQHPSTQDLLVTTGVGWMIGEGRYYLKNKLGPKHYWWIDPIHTTLEYLNIGVSRDREGNTQTTLRLTWKF